MHVVCGISSLDVPIGFLIGGCDEECLQPRIGMRSWGWWGRRWWCFPKGCWTQYLYPGPSGVTFFLSLYCFADLINLILCYGLLSIPSRSGPSVYSARVNACWYPWGCGQSWSTRKQYLVPKTGPARRRESHVRA